MNLRSRRLAHLIRAARPRKCESEAGITLLEVMVGMAILAITVGAILSATLVSTTGSSVNTRASRMNALLSSFGEAVKNLPYEECGTSSQYQASFDGSDDALQNDDQELRETLNATLLVESVVAGPDCPGADIGTQTITLKVTVDGDELDGQITKRDPAAVNIPITIGINIERLSPDNNPTVVWQLTSTSTSPNGIFRYEWWCDGDWAEAGDPEPTGLDPNGPDYFVTYSPIATNVVCTYNAPTTTGVLQTVALRVTDARNVTAIGWQSFELSTTPTPHIGPTAVIIQETAPTCAPGPTPPAQPCSTNTDIRWNANNSFSTTATIVAWRWTYGDGTPPVVCVLTDPWCTTVTHQYEGGGTFVLSLTVTDSLGAIGTATRQIRVDAPPLIKPSVSFTSSSLGASITNGVAPQRVTFNGAGSYADGYSPGAGTPPGGITMYSWSFGDGQVQSGATLVNPSHDYMNPGVYVVRLTVTGVNGASNYAETTITLTALQPPINLVNNGDHKADIPLFRDARFDFQWTNVPRSPGDTISYEIMISTASGFCSVIGWGMGGRVFTVAGGAAGTTQTYRAQFGNGSWPPGVPLEMCSTDSYVYRGRTVRQHAMGTSYSPWSAPVALEADFF